MFRIYYNCFIGEDKSQMNIMNYTFFRDFYVEVKESLENHKVNFLFGPRKCGKTVCLLQIENSFPAAEYFNFKALDYDGKNHLFDKINNSIVNNENKIYLLDEITYANNPEIEINKIALNFTKNPKTKTRILFTGSQSIALEAWAHRAFAGDCGTVRADFLSYSEFLRYKDIKSINEDSYNRFLFEAADFCNVHSLREYLEGCLEETIVSNSKSSEYIFDNDCELLKDNVDVLINLCYQTMFTLHNHASNRFFFQNNKLKDTVIAYFRETCNEFDNKNVEDKISKSFISAYNSIKSVPLKILKQGLLFLKKCELITLTPVTNSLNIIPNVYNDLINDEGSIDYKEDLFAKYNFCIKYPMFYVQILKDVLGKDMPKELPRMLLGSIVECHTRGLLKNGFEFRTRTADLTGKITEKEVDYISIDKLFAIEISISKRHNNNFDLLPKEISCFMLTKDINQKGAAYNKISYCDFIYLLSSTPQNLFLREIEKKYNNHENKGMKKRNIENETIQKNINKGKDIIKTKKRRVPSISD